MTTCTRCGTGTLRPHVTSYRVRVGSELVDVPGVPAEKCDNPSCGEVTILPNGLRYAKTTAKALAAKQSEIFLKLISAEQIDTPLPRAFDVTMVSTAKMTTHSQSVTSPAEWVVQSSVR